MYKLRTDERVGLPPRLSNMIYDGHPSWVGHAHQVAAYAAHNDLTSGQWAHREIPEDWTIAGRFVLSHSERKAMNLPASVSAVVIAVSPMTPRRRPNKNVDWYALPAGSDVLWHESAVPQVAHARARR